MRTTWPLLTSIVLIACGCSEPAPPAPMQDATTHDKATGEGLLELPVTPQTDLFGLTLSTLEGQTDYTEGEQIGFEISATTNCYVTAIILTSDNEMMLLLPNAWQPRGLVKASITTRIPHRQLGFRFPILPPHGAIHIKAVATAEPIALPGVTPQRLNAEQFVYLGSATPPATGTKSLPAPLTLESLSALAGEKRCQIVDLTITTRPLPSYDSRASDALYSMWETLQQTEGTKGAFTPVPYRRPNQPPSKTETDGVIAYYKSTPPSDTGLKSLPSNGAAPTHARRPGSPLAGARVVRGSGGGTKGLQGTGDLKAELERLANDPSVENAVPNYVRHLFSIPKTRYAPVQWALTNSFQRTVDTGWAAASDQIAAITPVRIAVVDQGLVVSDPRLRQLAWTNAREIPGNGLDDDANGWIDDRHGYNFFLDSTQLYYPDTDYNHGSFVSSIIAGRESGAMNDVIGYAPGAEIVTAVAMGPDGTGPDLSILEAIYYAAEQGAKVINLSLGGELLNREWFMYERAHRPLWQSLEQKGVLLVCAAGNSNANNDRRPHVPCNLGTKYNNVISVCAIDPDGALARFRDDDGNWQQYSNYGAKSVHIGAPGSLVLGIPDRGRQELGDGTSYAAPLVTAAAALVWGKHPNWSYREVKRAILETATPTPQLTGKCTTEGILNIAKALEWTPSAPVTPAM